MVFPCDVNTSQLTLTTWSTAILNGPYTQLPQRIVVTAALRSRGIAVDDPSYNYSCAQAENADDLRAIAKAKGKGRTMDYAEFRKELGL